MSLPFRHLSAPGKLVRRLRHPDSPPVVNKYGRMDSAEDYTTSCLYIWDQRGRKSTDVELDRAETPSAEDWA